MWRPNRNLLFKFRFVVFICSPSLNLKCFFFHSFSLFLDLFHNFRSVWAKFRRELNSTQIVIKNVRFENNKICSRNIQKQKGKKIALLSHERRQNNKTYWSASFCYKFGNTKPYRLEIKAFEVSIFHYLSNR